MFINELTPIFKELAQQPVAFMGGLFSGFLRLKLSDDPVQTWLNKQTGSAYPVPTATNNGKSGPQTISID
jgi:hypothetical protein